MSRVVRETQRPARMSNHLGSLYRPGDLSAPLFAKEPSSPYTDVMSLMTLVSVLVLYPLTLFGDGCLLIAVALAATVGGRPLVWGASFALFHAIYGIIGILVASEIGTYSERLGDIFVLAGALLLLRHFMHHRLHHLAGGDCSCENHAIIPLSTRAIVSTASALSVHSLASGAIVRSMIGEVSTTTLIILLVAVSLVVGAMIAAIVLIGDKERTPIMRGLDSLPGVVTTILSGVSGFSIYHLLSDFWDFSTIASVLFALVAGAISVALGYRVHVRAGSMNTHSLTSISRRRTTNY